MKALIIDSGIGGTSLLPCFFKKLPFNSYIYFADTKNLPYGNKTKKELFEITKNNLNFLIKKYKPNIIIFGCNTIGTTIIEEIKNYFPNQRIFAIKPNLEQVSKYNSSLVLATSTTIKTLKQKGNIKSCIVLKPMQNLATKIENNLQNISNIVPYLKRSLKNYKNINCIVLGCTHYYYVKPLLKKIFAKVEIIDGVDFLCQSILDKFSEIKLKNKKIKVKILFSKKTNSTKRYKKIILNLLKG